MGVAQVAPFTAIQCWASLHVHAVEWKKSKINWRTTLLQRRKVGSSFIETSCCVLSVIKSRGQGRISDEKIVEYCSRQHQISLSMIDKQMLTRTWLSRILSPHLPLPPHLWKLGCLRRRTTWIMRAKDIETLRAEKIRRGGETKTEKEKIVKID